MTTITINERTKAGKSFLEFARNLPFVKINEGLGKPSLTKEEKFYLNFEKSLEEASKITSGKKKGISLKKTLDEI